MELKTVQTNAIRILVEALKEILSEANIEFDSTGLKIVAMDSTKTILVHLKLVSEKFDKYYCKSKVIIGVNMLNLHKIIKTVSTTDTLTFHIDESDQNVLGIVIENGEKNSVTSVELNLMDLNEEKIDIPPQEFDSIITMPSQDFTKHCRDIHNLGCEVLEIRSVGSQLYFGGKGDSIKKIEIESGEASDGINIVKQSQAI